MEKYIYRAKLERVVDGDTIDALIDVGFDIWIKKRIRYMGVVVVAALAAGLVELKVIVCLGAVLICLACVSTRLPWVLEKVTASVEKQFYNVFRCPFF